MGLAEWNSAEVVEAEAGLLACCGSAGWARAVAAGRPYASYEELMETAEREWFGQPEAEWLAAFACHPRIGEKKAPVAAGAQFAAWSGSEQGAAQATLAAVEERLVAGNREYEAKFGFLYIVFASGRTAPELLEVLESRLGNDRAAELLEAARQQWRITELRMGKLVVGG
jgi:OHCU decarboxylase